MVESQRETQIDPRVSLFSQWLQRREAVHIMSESDVLANQKTILQNQKTVIANQGAIQANQKTIKGNQANILRNQASILKNQRTLDTIVKNQKQILAKLKK